MGEEIRVLSNALLLSKFKAGSSQIGTICGETDHGWLSAAGESLFRAVLWLLIFYHRRDSQNSKTSTAVRLPFASLFLLLGAAPSFELVLDFRQLWSVKPAFRVMTASLCNRGRARRTLIRGSPVVCNFFRRKQKAEFTQLSTN